MKSAFSIGVLVLACALSPTARAQAPQWEVFGGASYLHVGSGSNKVTLSDGTTATLKQSYFGWHASGGENVTNWFGGTFDFSGSYLSQTIGGVRFNTSEYPFLFGPQFALRRNPRVSLFAHPLIGGVHSRATFSGSTGHVSETHWAYALGGGADFRISDHVSARTQVDYIRSHFPQSLARDFQNDVRVSGGLVWTIGTAPKQ